LIVAVSINGIGPTVAGFNRASDFLANSKSAFGVLYTIIVPHCVDDDRNDNVTVSSD